MTMMETQLTAWLLFSHAERHHGEVEIVSRLADGRVVRHTYAQYARRTRQLMHALDALGLAPDATVATLAWNHHYHLEAYFGIPCSGRVLHTLNVRLAPAELGFIIQDAHDVAILADADMLPLLEQVHRDGNLAGVEHILVLGSEVPATSLPGVQSYDALLAAQPEAYEPKDLDESRPYGLCYTSGTTGRPKGVMYTHRSSYLHALAVSSGAGMSVGPMDCVLPIVPMFHAACWGLPQAALAVGAKQVYAAGPFDPEAVADLIVAEEVTIGAGVPTVWIGLEPALDRRGGRFPSVRHLVCGGSQPPRALIERYISKYDIPIAQAWGMTETSPLASMGWPRHMHRHLPEADVITRARSQAGLPLPGIDISIRDEQGNEVAADGESMGDLYCRGPWVADSYVGNAEPEKFADGWFRTGDVAVEQPSGYFVIADRSKDLIKSGGEWISSVDMEAGIMAMPEVLEACVVAIPDPKWQERPLACVVVKEGVEVSLAQVHEHLLGRGWAKWQLPDRLEVIDEVPRTSVGKFDKKVLRARFAEAAATVPAAG